MLSTKMVNLSQMPQVLHVSERETFTHFNLWQTQNEDKIAHMNIASRPILQKRPLTSIFRQPTKEKLTDVSAPIVECHSVPNKLWTTT